MTNEAAANKRLNRGGSIVSGIDKGLFLVVFLAGAAGIVALKVQGYSQLVATATPVGMMFLYLGFILFTKRFQLREDQSADNMYYLGFLFTLTSLACALYQFGRDQTGTADIISNFGIALSTTIVGLAARVLLNQMRQDPIEVEREARLDLAVAVSKLRAELDSTVVDMNAFRRTIQQSIADGYQELNEIVQKSLGQNVERLGEVTTKIKETAEATFAAFGESSARLNQLVTRTSNSVEKILDGLEKVDVPSDLIARKLNPFIETFEAISRTVRDRAGAEVEQATRLQKMVDVADALLRQAKEGSGQLTLQIQGLEQSIQRVRQIEEPLQRFRQGVDSTAESITQAAAAQIANLREIGELARHQVETAKAHNSALATELDRARAMVGQTGAALASMAELVVEKLGSTNTVVSPTQRSDS